MYENLCLEGGGIKVIAFCGALKVLREKGVLENIKRYIGSSGGAIVAAALACGYSVDELKEDMLGDDFGILRDDSWGFIRDLYRIIRKFGFYKGDAFIEWFGNKLKAKTGNADITFKEIYEKYGKTLVVTGSCINKRETHYYHHESNPNMPVRLAVRISISIPFFMQAVRWGGDILVDGGVFNNYPITYFDKFDTLGHLPNSKKGLIRLEGELGNKTLGLKLLGKNERSGSWQIFQGNDHIRNLKDFLLAIVNGYCSHVENLYVKPGYWKHTIGINVENIKTTQFELKRQEKEYLVTQGEFGAEKFFSLYK